MPRRTLSEAKQILEQDVIPSVSDHWAREFRGQLEVAENRARERAASFAEERAAEVIENRTEALKMLAAARDGFDDLASLGKRGEVSARDFTAQLLELRQQQQDAEALLAQAEEKLAIVEQVEADPVRWFDDLARRTPSIMEDFAW
jgi:hypothetical protein